MFLKCFALKHLQKVAFVRYYYYYYYYLYTLGSKDPEG